MTQEQYVSYEVAKLLHEKGFQINPNVDYWKIGSDGHMYFMSSIGAYTDNPNNQYAYYRPKDSYPAPTQQMAMRWLREVHNLHIQLFIGNDSSNDADGNEVETWYFWSFSINGVPTGVVIYDDLAQFDCVEYQSYEDAAEAAIKYCLEHLI